MKQKKGQNNQTVLPAKTGVTQSLKVQWKNLLYLDDVVLNDFKNKILSLDHRALTIHKQAHYQFMHAVLFDFSQSLARENSALFEHLFMDRPHTAKERFRLCVDEPKYVWSKEKEKQFNRDFCHLMQNLEDEHLPTYQGALYELMHAFQRQYQCYLDI